LPAAHSAPRGCRARPGLPEAGQATPWRAEGSTRFVKVWAAPRDA